MPGRVSISLRCALRDRLVLGALLWLPLPQTTEATTRPAAPRLVIGGKVMRVDGSAWGGAGVVLHSLPWGLDEQVGFLDRIEVKADADGSFSARVLPTRTYSVWARSEVDDGGGHRVSGVVRWLAGAGGLSLREDAERRVPVRVQLQGREAWRDLEPLTCDGFVMLDDRVTLPCVIGAGGTVRVPPVPAHEFFLRVRGRNGVLIASGSVPVTEKDRAALLAAPPRAHAEALVTRALDLTVVTLPPPRALLARIEDLDGRPVAGAEVSWRDRAETGVLARSDERGLARWVVPFVSSQDAPGAVALDLWIQAEHSMLGHWYSAAVALQPAVRTPREPDLVLRLPPGHCLTGRVMWKPGQPAGRIPLFLHSRVPIGSAGGFGGATGYGGESITYWTDADGRFVIPGRRGDLDFQISTFLTPDQVRLAAAPAPFPMSPRIVLASGRDPGGDQDLGDIVIATFQPLDVQLSGPGPGPRTVRVQFREDAGPDELLVGAEEVEADGRLRILKRPDHVMRLGISVAGQPTRTFRIPGDHEWRPGEPVKIVVEGR